MNRNNKTLKFLGLAAVSCLAVASAMALGFANPDQGARATGQGEAFVAQADDASAIYYNPAGLTQIKGTELMMGAYVSSRDIRYDSVVPGGDTTLSDPFYTAHAYAVTDFGLERWRFGFGMNVPFGNAVDWGKKTIFSQGITSSSLKVMNYQPTVAFKVCDQLSLGVGLNIYDGTTTLGKVVAYSPYLPNGQFRFEGSGQAVGCTVGILWKPLEKHTFGLTYRSPFAIDFEGGAYASNDPTGGGFGKAASHAEIQFPQSLTVGYAFRPVPQLKLEFDAEWTDWDSLNNVQLHSKNPTFENDPSSTIPFNWMSSWYYEFGVQYDLTTNWAVRAGYIFSENSVPNKTFSPVLPDGDRHVLSAGVSYAMKHFSVDVAYQYSLTEDRKVNNAIAPGEWQSSGHALMVSGHVTF